MSLFGSIMGDFDDDPIFGPHMRSMRQMNNMMNSLFADPFGMMGGSGFPALTGGPDVRGSHDSLMPFGFPQMPNINRLLSGSLDSLAAEAATGNCHSYSSSSVVRLSSGPDGKPQVYRASASSRSGPGGIRETQRTVQDSTTGTKKMAIGHHIGERAHIIEREQNVLSGDQEERQEFINLEEEEADTFNQEFQVKARGSRLSQPAITGAPSSRHRHVQLALPPAGTSSHRRNRTSGSRVGRSSASPLRTTGLASPRRPLRPSAVSPTPNSSTSVNHRPYSPPGAAATATSSRRHHRNIKTVSGPPDL